MKIGNSNISTPVYVSFKMSGCEHTIGNTETVVLKEATCNQEGKLEKITYCSKCGEVIDRITENVPMKRHSFTAWEVTKEAACENGGVETRRCEFCGLKEEKENPKTWT